MRSLEERFWSKVDKSAGEDSCWLWTARVTTTGYGGFDLSKRKPVYAHRMAYQLSSGEPVPPNMHIDHLCHVPLCVNPAHLRCVTPKQNAENHNGAKSNNRSGVRGVYWSRSCKKWVGQVTHHRKVYHCGVFVNIEDAAEAVRALRNSLHSHNDHDRRPPLVGAQG